MCDKTGDRSDRTSEGTRHLTEASICAKAGDQSDRTAEGMRHVTGAPICAKAEDQSGQDRAKNRGMTEAGQIRRTTAEDHETFDANRIREMAGCGPVFFRECVDSTNEWAKRESSRAADGTVFLADSQSGGKGRCGRAWNSPAGTSVSMSILLRPEGIPNESLSMLTLVMGLAAAKAIARVCGLPVQIKWPNDVVYSGRKLCGILTELGPDVSYVIIGIGLNINMTEFPDELKERAVSMRMATGHPIDREVVTAAVLKEFAGCREAFLKTGDLTLLVSEYEALLANRGERVRVLDSVSPYTGKALGITNRGELLVRKEDGSVERVYSGEVSVRGIYGYV